MRILIVEDEALLAETIRTLLESRGYQADVASDGGLGLEYARTKIYDLMIVDVMMPVMNGFELTRKVRAEKIAVKILMLTARADVMDRIDGLDAGADYYLTKPFDSRELLACIHALLRRQGEQIDSLSFGNTVLDLASGSLMCGEKQIRLSAKELDLCRILMQNGKNNISKEMLLEKIWGFDSNATENQVEVYVTFLRKKLKSIGSDVRIEAVRRLGYHLETAADSEELQKGEQS